MPSTPFIVHTALVCHDCLRTAVVTQMQSWRDVSPIGHETAVLEIVFTTCIFCYNTLMSLIPMYIDPLKYSNLIHHLEKMFQCTKNILQKKTFVLNRMKRKRVAKLYDESEIFQMETVSDSNIRIIQPELQNSSRFFKHDSCSTRRLVTQYMPAGFSSTLLASDLGRATLCFRCRSEVLSSDQSSDFSEEYGPYWKLDNGFE